MNLNNMMRDASLSNLRWLEDGMETTFQPQNKDTDSKDDLALQWGLGSIGKYNYQDSAAARKDAVQTNNTAEIVQKTREYLNQGMSERECLVMLLGTFPKEEIVAAKSATARVRKLTGILGRVAVDVRGYKNPKDAMKHAAKSPYKKFIKYVVGYKGDNITYITDNGSKSILGSDINSTGNAADDFLATETPKVANNTGRAYCKDVMMPVLAHSFDLDHSEADSNLIELNAGGYITSDEIAKIKAENKTAYSQIKQAFLLIDQKKLTKAASKYSGKVDTSQFAMKKSEMNITLARKVKAAAQVEEVAMPTQKPITLPDEKFMATPQVDIERDAGLQVTIGKKAAAPAEVNQKEVNLPVKIAAKNKENLNFKMKKADVQVSIDAENKKKSLKFRMKKASMNVEYPKAPKASMEVDEQTWVPPEMNGVDIVELDEVKKPQKPLDIDGKSDFSW